MLYYYISKLSLDPLFESLLEDNYFPVSFDEDLSLSLVSCTFLLIFYIICKIFLCKINI